MARFLLKKIADKADGLDQLGELLLPHIPSDGGRVEFQQALALLKKKLLATGTGAGMETPGSSAGMRSAGLPTRPFDAAWADTTATRLVTLIGPIGRIVARRAMKQTSDRAAFLELLANLIDNADQRARFLQETDA